MGTGLDRGSEIGRLGDNQRLIDEVKLLEVLVEILLDLYGLLNFFGVVLEETLVETPDLEHLVLELEGGSVLASHKLTLNEDQVHNLHTFLFGSNEVGLVGVHGLKENLDRGMHLKQLKELLTPLTGLLDLGLLRRATVDAGLLLETTLLTTDHIVVVHGSAIGHLVVIDDLLVTL